MRGGKKPIISFFWFYVREKRERESSNFSLRSKEIEWSEFVGPRVKVHLLDEGYA